MQHRRLGGSGLVVSELAYGNWITHGGQVEQGTATACVQAAFDAGITFFDTADEYLGGAAETVLGQALAGARRSSYVLATKVFYPTGDTPTERGLSRKHIREACDASLRRLGTDYIDLYQAHRWDPNTPLEETLRAFDDLVRAGKVLYVGVSEWRAPQIARALDLAEQLGFDRIVSNQPEYSLLWRVIEDEVVPICRERGVGQVVFSPLTQGVLTGKYKAGAEAPVGSRATDANGGRFVGRWLRDEVLTRVAQLEPLAADAGLTLSQLALAWVLRNTNVSAAIIGASRPSQVRDNVSASGVVLDDDLVAAVDAVLDPVVERDPAKTR
ncbi:aldo/keto reductase family protein [Acidothermaceae bacterium B102]|nr:aldo/keto reductase family protein [Acidothermaceae bacterium B102]